jgi:hypothetical protein
LAESGVGVHNGGMPDFKGLWLVNHVRTEALALYDDKLRYNPQDLLQGHY